MADNSCRHQEHGSVAEGFIPTTIAIECTWWLRTRLMGRSKEEARHLENIPSKTRNNVVVTDDLGA